MRKKKMMVGAHHEVRMRLFSCGARI
jgi:hypothetical protein